MGFQTSVNNQPAPGVEGSIASANPVATFVTGPGGLVTGANGATVARFAWTNDGLNVSNNSTDATSVAAAGAARTPQGFLANEQQGLITPYLSQAGMTVLAGQEIELFTRGDFWAKMKNAASVGMKAFANLLTGEVYPAAAGSVVSASTVTASFATNVMTVTASTGTLKVGHAITGAGVPANTYISSLGTGTGGAGTYNLSTAPGTIASQSNTASEYIETPYSILSAALTGELAKIGYGN
jgi:hypothetical protein